LNAAVGGTSVSTTRRTQPAETCSYASGGDVSDEAKCGCHPTTGSAASLSSKASGIDGVPISGDGPYCDNYLVGGVCSCLMLVAACSSWRSWWLSRVRRWMLAAARWRWSARACPQREDAPRWRRTARVVSVTPTRTSTRTAVPSSHHHADHTSTAAT
jgi:hypothetical protein